MFVLLNDYKNSYLTLIIIYTINDFNINWIIMARKSDENVHASYGTAGQSFQLY